MSVYYAVMEEVEVTEVDGPSSGKESASLVWTPAMTLQFLARTFIQIRNKIHVFINASAAPKSSFFNTKGYKYN